MHWHVSMDRVRFDIDQSSRIVSEMADEVYAHSQWIEV